MGFLITELKASEKLWGCAAEYGKHACWERVTVLARGRGKLSLGIITWCPLGLPSTEKKKLKNAYSKSVR